MNNKILVTGSEGFIGSLLVLKLKSKGYNVVEWDEKNGDISTSPIELKNIDHVFHLAAQTFVPRSWENPYPILLEPLMCWNFVKTTELVLHI